MGIQIDIGYVIANTLKLNPKNFVSISTFNQIALKV